MSQEKKRAKRVRARKHRDRLRTTSLRSMTIHFPVERHRLRCATCKQDVIRKVTEPIPHRCPFCRDRNATFVKKETISAV